MKRTAVIGLMLVLAAMAGAALYVPIAEAQSFTTVRPGGRGGGWDFYLPIVYADKARIVGENGTSIDVNSDYGFGFGGGYNLNDHFQLNGLLTWNYRSYEATTVNTDGSTRKYNNNVDTSSLTLNGVFYLLNGDITPFISAGVGVVYVDTNIPTGSGSTACWWDPWYGYVCSSYVSTKTENDMSYNAGIGVRMDINRQFGLQAGYYKTWIDFSKASGDPDFDIWRFDIIFRM